MPPLLVLSLAACTGTKPPQSGGSQPAPMPAPVVQNPTAGHASIAPGQYVGPLQATTTHADLVQRLGASAVSEQDVDIGEGQVQAGTVIHEGTDHELRAVWSTPERNDLAWVHVIGTAWELPGGIHPGASLSELTSSLGTFGFIGFVGDNSGFIELAGTPLASHADTTSLRLIVDTGSEACRSTDLHAQKLTSDAQAVEACSPSLGDVILRF